jgi:hypothetical protein
LFNESKLLQQLGALCLAIHDNRLTRITFEHDGEPFGIRLTENGELSVANITFWQGDEDVQLWTNYNSLAKNPLLFLDPFSGDASYVFDDQGDFTSRFYSKFN